ncbi:MAG: tRNA lysidine(34) synthetase TilS [Planctomycetota bacterium]|jgi:tRNA(Ile)-lysidine synthase
MPPSSRHAARRGGSTARSATSTRRRPPELRYAALVDVAEAVGAPFIAVAHHAEDQLETILMALGRGAGLEGLSGMRWSTPSPGGGSTVRIVRPLLDVRRAECEALCQAAELRWRDDPRNRDPSSARARVRLEVVPVLESLWPDVASRVAASADLLEAARLELETLLDQRFGPPSRRRWPRATLRELPMPIVAAGLRRAAREQMREGLDRLGQRQLTQAAEAVLDDDRRPRTFHWPDGIEVVVRSEQVEMVGSSD